MRKATRSVVMPMVVGGEKIINPDKMLECLWERQAEWRKNESQKIEFSFQDKQNVSDLVDEAIRLAGDPNDSNVLAGLDVNNSNMPVRLGDSESNMLVSPGIWVPLPGIGNGVGVRAKGKRAPGSKRITFKLELVSFNYVWGGICQLGHLKLITGGQAWGSVSGEEWKQSLLNHLFVKIDEFVNSVKDWYGKVREFGFYVLPTGLQSVIPVGNGVLLDEWSPITNVLLTFIVPDRVGETREGDELLMVLRNIINLDFQSAQDLYASLPRWVLEKLWEMDKTEKTRGINENCVGLLSLH